MRLNKDSTRTNHDANDGGGTGTGLPTGREAAAEALGASKGFWRRLQQSVNLARDLALTGGELLQGLPQRRQTLRYLLHLLRVEGAGDRRVRRDRLRS
jgi:hypothetical protein